MIDEVRQAVRGEDGNTKSVETRRWQEDQAVIEQDDKTIR